MPSSTVARAWPEPGWVAVSLAVSFAATLTLAWTWGRDLVEAVLPLARHLIQALDDRFVIQFLGVEQGAQDTVVRLRVHLAKLLVVGGRVAQSTPQGWSEVTTTVGAMLQPLILAVGLAGGWPGHFAARLLGASCAALLGLLFLLADLPLTLHAYVWDIFVYAAGTNAISPLLAWHNFLHSGGRLGVGILLGVTAHAAAGRLLAPGRPIGR